MSLQPFNTLSQYNNTLFKAPDLLVLNRMLSFALFLSLLPPLLHNNY
jgi:hypothetical protein